MVRKGTGAALIVNGRLTADGAAHEARPRPKRRGNEVVSQTRDRLREDQLIRLILSKAEVPSVQPPPRPRRIQQPLITEAHFLHQALASTRRVC
jgi:hypothetical protein